MTISAVGFNNMAFAGSTTKKATTSAEALIRQAMAGKPGEPSKKMVQAAIKKLTDSGVPANQAQTQVRSAAANYKRH